MLTTIAHESTHAATAYALGVRSTLFNYFVDIDLPRTASVPRAIIGIAGPVASLAIAIAAWILFRRRRDSALELPVLYLAVFGIATFAGNVMSVAFVGDFTAAAAVLHAPMLVRYALAAIGALAVAAIHFWAGRQLARWTPPDGTTTGAVLGMIVLPAVLGTVVVMLLNQPAPGIAPGARAAEASFWVFAAVAMIVTTSPVDRRREIDLVRSVDFAVLFVAAITIRLMVHGIAFVP